MRWSKVSGMKLKPYRCAGCGSTPQKEDGSGPEDAYFAEGVDINWGDSLYICSSCVRVIGQLAGMLDPDAVIRLENEKEKALTEAEELQEELNRVDTRLKRIVDGSKAVKEEKARQAKKPTKKVKASA